MTPRPTAAPGVVAPAVSNSVAASAPAPVEPPPVVPEYRDVVIPSGTILAVDLRTSVGSDTSAVEEAVNGTLRTAIQIRGEEILPAGTTLAGHVTEVDRAGRVKGRARVAFRFTSLDAPGPGGRTTIKTESVIREAEATKRKDATKIGGSAAGGAVLGAIIGGGDGAAKGAVIGGAAGTGLVLSTRGKAVTVPSGTNLTIRLTAPVTIRIRS